MMPVSLRLAIRQWLTRPLRPVLCTVAIAAAVALVLTIGAGFDSLKSSLKTGIGQMLGIAEIHLRPEQRGTFARVSEQALMAMRGMKDIQMASGRLEAQVQLHRTRELKASFKVVGVDAGDGALAKLDFVSGRAFTPENADAVVIDEGVAKALQIAVDDNVDVYSDEAKPVTVTVMGIVKQQAGATPEVFLPDSMIAKLGADKPVAEAWVHNPVSDLWFDAVGSEPELDEKLRPKKFVAGTDFVTGRSDEMVIDETVAGKMKVGLGDEVEVFANEGVPRKVKVVGIVKRPQIEFLSKPTVFLPTVMLAQLIGLKEPAYNVVDVRLAAGTTTDLDKYSEGMGAEIQEREELGKMGSPADGNQTRAQVHTQWLAAMRRADAGFKEDATRVAIYKATSATTRTAQFENETQMLRVTLLILSVISATCAALIIGTTLSVGVQERLRQFGHLRCIGASRWQLVSFLMADAVVLAGGGVLSGVGLGVGLSWALVAHYPTIFLTWVISGGSLILAVLTGLLATLLGSLIPAWQIARITPMQAVRAAATEARRRNLWVAAACGAAAIMTQILLWQVSGTTARFYLYVLVGIPLVFAGYALLAPLLLVAMEKVAAKPVAYLFFVRPALLKQAWSRTPWRAGAVVAALMIGVTLFTSIRARSHGIMASFTLPSELPDFFIAKIGGMKETQAGALLKRYPDQLEQATVATFFPVTVKADIFGASQLTGTDYTQFVCMNPDVAKTMFHLEFLQGDPAQAWKRLKEGQAIFVSREFQIARGIKVGDVIPIETKTHGVVDFTVAAVVSSTAMDVAKNFFDIRSAVQAAEIASVLGTLDDARKYFDVQDYLVMLANLKKGLGTNAAAVSKMRLELTKQGYQVATAFDMKTSITQLMNRVIDSLSMIGVGALALASLGVANLVIASTHARRFEFGVLRAIGAGRGTLLRMVLAEIAMIAVVASFLGSMAGLHFVYMGTRLDRLLVGFPTRFVENWADVVYISWILALALVITLGIACLASFLPALKSSMSAQRELLATARG